MSVKEKGVEPLCAEGFIERGVRSAGGLTEEKGGLHRISGGRVLLASECLDERQGEGGLSPCVQRG